MSIYRSYLLKNNFWAKKGNEKGTISEKVFIRHGNGVAIYATIKKRGVKLTINYKDFSFNNFDKLDSFLIKLTYEEKEFLRIVRRMFLCQKLREFD